MIRITLDISEACGSQACTPKCTVIFPEECPNGLHGSYYTFDPSVYGEHSGCTLTSGQPGAAWSGQEVCDEIEHIGPMRHRSYNISQS